MRRVSVAEYSKIADVTEKTVRSWIGKGKIPVAMEEVNGRLVKRIIVEDNEMLTIDSIDTGSIDTQCKSNVSGNVAMNSAKEDESLSVERQIGSTILTKLIDENNLMRRDLLDLTKKYLETAELAGQAKLLTDSENKTKEQYFEVIQEKAHLKAAFEVQQKELERLRDKLDKLENQSSFWDVLFKKI